MHLLHSSSVIVGVSMKEQNITTFKTNDTDVIQEQIVVKENFNDDRYFS